MTKEKAAAVLRFLADGIDPATGEVLDAGHVCNEPEVIRALYTAVDALAPKKAKRADSYVRKDGMLNMDRPWTEDDLEALRSMYQAGYTMPTICQTLQRRQRGVLKQLAYLGLAEGEEVSGSNPERAGQKWTDEEDDILRELHAEKWPIGKIAAKMQRTKHAIFCRMQKLELFGGGPGYPTRAETDPWTMADNQELRDMFQNGEPLHEIADHFGCTEKCIMTRLFYMGLVEKP